MVRHCCGKWRKEERRRLANLRQPIFGPAPPRLHQRRLTAPVAGRAPRNSSWRTMTKRRSPDGNGRAKFGIVEFRNFDTASVPLHSVFACRSRGSARRTASDPCSLRCRRAQTKQRQTRLRSRCRNAQQSREDSMHEDRANRPNGLQPDRFWPWRLIPVWQMPQRDSERRFTIPPCSRSSWASITEDRLDDQP
jgi:hypothetical protein